MAKRKRRDLRSAGQPHTCKGGQVVVDPNDCPENQSKLMNSTGQRVKVVKPSRVPSAANNQDFMFATGLKKPLEDFLVEVGIITIGVGVWYYVMSPILKKAGAKPLSL